MAIGTIFAGCSPPADAARTRPHFAPMRSSLEIAQRRRLHRGSGRRPWARVITQKPEPTGVAAPAGPKPKTFAQFW